MCHQYKNTRGFLKCGFEENDSRLIALGKTLSAFHFCLIAFICNMFLSNACLIKLIFKKLKHLLPHANHVLFDAEQHPICKGLSR